MDKKIVEQDNIFFCCGKPVPPYFHLECEAELIIRLRATRSGSADWFAEGKAWSALNDAPRNPLLRAVVKWFYWTPPGEIDRRGDQVPPDWVVQVGKSLPNWMAEVKEPLPDPQGDFLILLTKLDGIPGRKPEYRQGALEVHYPPSWPEAMNRMRLGSMEPWLRRKGAGFQIFNHYVSGSDGFFRRVIKDWMFVFTHFSQFPVWVLSSDHPDEPLRLECHYPDNFVVFAHPFPRRDGGID